MKYAERSDDFERRRSHIRTMSDDELHTHFWKLVDEVVSPLVEEARTSTSPSIERSVLLRMGFSSVEAKDLVTRMVEHDGLLEQGAGHIVLKLATAKRVSVREAGLTLLEGRWWEDVRP